MNLKTFLLISLVFSLSLQGKDTLQPSLEDMASGKGWNLSSGFKAESRDLQGKAALRIVSDGTGERAALALLREVTFTNGEIELDILGPQDTRMAFIGLAFRIQNEEAFDLVYFRPQKFGKTKKPGDLDGEVQYSSEPTFPWSVTRKLTPLKFEKNIPNAPKAQTEWFHARIVVNGSKVTVFVDGATEPCLTVEQSLSDRQGGGLGLWTWSGGAFANLKITPLAN